MSASDKKKFRKEQETAALTEKQLTQKKEDKQLKTYTITFIVVMVLVAAIAVGSVGINWYNNSGIPARNTVAVTIGDTELSNVDLSYYYIDAINNFYETAYDSYGSYTTLYVQYLYGLDMSTALNLQVYNEETGDTWADYFIDTAIGYAKATYALYNEAMANDYVISEDFETELNAALASIKALAASAGYTSLDDYLEAYYGVGANEETFVNYYTVNAIADAYYSDYANTMTYTQDEIDAYNEEHYDSFSLFDYSYYYVYVSDFLPEKEVAEGETAEYTADEREAARAAAEAAANKLATANSIALLDHYIAQMEVETVSTTATSNTNITIASVNSLYSDWIKDSARKAGDATVVPYETTTTDDDGNETTTVNGYYVVLFEGREDFNDLMINVRHILVAYEGGTKETDEDGNTTTVYSDAEKQAAYDKAEALYNQWLAGDKTEESFAALATEENSDDSGSNTNGGLYEKVYQGAMVEAFNDWCFAEGREAGDTGIVETEFGYHIMYFSGYCDQSYREYCIEYTLRSNDASVWYNALVANVTTAEGNTDYMPKNLVIVSSSSS